MTPSITADQRSLLYEDILSHLSGIGDIELAMNQKNYETARRLGMDFSDDLRLMSEDLGWDENGPDEVIELKTPPDVLRRTLSRVRDVALSLNAGEEAERVALRENQKHHRLVVKACQQVLADLDREDAIGSNGPR